MNVAALQLDCVWEDKAANYRKVRAMLAGIAPGTLVVLPEMFATGFTGNLDLAEDTGEAVAAIAKEYRVNLLAGLVRSRRNEAVLFNPDGREIARYAKLHPFRPGGEATDAGTAPVVIPLAGFQLAPVICYDLRFPEDFRASVKLGTTVFAVIASWPAARIEHWVALLKARAIENQAYVIGANRCGDDPNHNYPGRSQIINPRGEILLEAGDAECLIQAELDLAALEAYRREFPALQELR
ncbi:MAG: Omega-amidase YafV [Verrucomicrobiae bacterium]|nr:Omega-amidase YafV [Verrucomicrobiae bacterium]